VPVEISGPPGGRAPVDVVEDDGALLRRLATSGAERLRLLAPCDDPVRAASHDADIAIDETPVTHHGRVELPCWLREQAISRTVHRHGRVP
jgi:RHH-type transcriptional regulator, proline utilization regulon repressor / proline dehydrogenase / delta 1-pyrroline-5-carboxylate dehydrogenase